MEFQHSWVENLEPEHELLNEQLFADYDKELSHADCRQWQNRNARLWIRWRWSMLLLLLASTTYPKVRRSSA